MCIEAISLCGLMGWLPGRSQPDGLTLMHDLVSTGMPCLVHMCMGLTLVHTYSVWGHDV